MKYVSKERIVEIGKGYCKDWRYLKVGGYPGITPGANPLVDCASRCEADFGPQAAFYVNAKKQCACSKGSCGTRVHHDSYTSYQILPEGMSPGESRYDPAVSCRAIYEYKRLAGHPEPEDGRYWIKAGSKVVHAMCKFAQGTGWTLLVNHDMRTNQFFHSYKTAVDTNGDNPSAPTYSILKHVGSFSDEKGKFEFLYENVQHGYWVWSQQNENPLSRSQCPTTDFSGSKGVVKANFKPGDSRGLFCGYAKHKDAALVGYPPNWTHGVGQYVTYGKWPGVCTYNKGYKCNHVRFWVRGRGGSSGNKCPVGTTVSHDGKVCTSQSGEKCDIGYTHGNPTPSMPSCIINGYEVDNEKKKTSSRPWNFYPCPSGLSRYGDGSACKGGSQNCDLGYVAGSPNRLPKCTVGQQL